MNDTTTECAIDWNKDLAIAACVAIARSPKATPADVKDAKNLILLMVGACDWFKDQNGKMVMSPRTFVQMYPHTQQAQIIRSDLGMASAMKSRALLVDDRLKLAYSNVWARR